MNWGDVAALAEGDVHVIGLASTEGAAVTRFLWSEGVHRLTIHDFLAGDALREAFFRFHVGMGRPQREAAWRELAAIPVGRCLGERYLAGVETATALFVPQGWGLYDRNRVPLAKARRLGVPFHSLTELYFGLAGAPITAITGSHGKSTTSRMVESILAAAGRRVYFAGNERGSVQVLDKLRTMGADDALVLEVSNRQLVDLEARPQVAVLTNIMPNHLQEHGGSLEEYRQVKGRLFALQGPEDAAVFNADDAASAPVARASRARVHAFSRHRPQAQGAWVEDGRILLRLNGAPAVDAGPVAAAGLPGDHNVANVLAAARAAWVGGAPAGAVEAGLVAFRPLRHRLQPVWRANGVVYYDDLNATTPAATLAAFRALGEPAVWIAGGNDKGLAFDALAAQARRCRLVLLLPGEGSDRLGAALEAAGAPVTRFDTFPGAVARAVAEARPGDAVLLSPGCPGFYSRHYVGSGAAGFRALLRRLAPAAPRPSPAPGSGSLQRRS
ncbi:MAG: UDP-N-acetylmuramoyl-L-alanine--D-glutamate ligase [Anaerolineae bacterium]